MSTYIRSLVQQLPDEGQDAEDEIQTAVVDEDGSTPVRTFFQTQEPVSNVINKPRSFWLEKETKIIINLIK